MPDYLKIEKGLGPEGRIAVVRFDRGDGINALSPEALRQLTQAALSFEDDGDTSVVVLTGSAKTFSAGFDLKDPEGRARRTMDLGALRRSLKVGPRLTDHGDGRPVADRHGFSALQDQVNHGVVDSRELMLGDFALDHCYTRNSGLRAPVFGTRSQIPQYFEL